ncbi:MAG TPA: O-antigen ligase family protein [Kofleriaceae bacterium]
MRRRDGVSIAFGGAALAVSVLALGGALRWTQALVGVLVAIALALQLPSKRRLDRRSPLLVLVGLAVLFTALQLVPLPHPVLESADHIGVELRDSGAAIAHTSPWPSLSLDPAGTLRALGFFAILFGVAVVALRFAASERGRFVLLGGVAIVAGLAAAVTGLHTLLNADSLYGIYQPAHATPPVLGPLLNANHLGCLMALGTTIAIGLAFYGRQRTGWRVLWIVIATGCAAVALASLSRGATLALCLGVGVAAVISIAARLGAAEHGGRRRALIQNQLPIAIVVLGGLGLAVYSSAGNVADQLANTSISEASAPASKFEAWRSSMALVAQAPWTGVGRGAFEPSFTRVHEPAAYVTFSHAENEYVQAVVDWGIPAALALAAALLVCARQAIKRWRDGPLAAAALGGMAGVLFQSSVDFGVELMGLAVPVIVVMATLLYVPVREAPHPQRSRLARGGLVAALAAAAWLLLQPATRSVQEDHDAITAGPATDSLLHDAVARHPLDYLAFGVAADEKFARGDRDAVTYLNHALTLHPTLPGLHRLAARALIHYGDRAQAALEYSLAMKGSPAPHQLLAEIVKALPAAPEAASALDLDPPDRAVVLRSLTELGRLDVAEQWLARVVARPAPELSVVDQLYALAMELDDTPGALAAANTRMALAHTNTSRLDLARVEFREKAWPQVVTTLADVEQWHGRTDEKADAWLLLCDAMMEQRKWDDSLECIHHVDASGLVLPSSRGKIDLRLQTITDQRTAEAKLQAIQDMERTLKLPVDTYLPVVSGAGPVGPVMVGAPSPDGSAAAPVGIPREPIVNPLLKQSP